MVYFFISVIHRPESSKKSLTFLLFFYKLLPITGPPMAAKTGKERRFSMRSVSSKAQSIIRQVPRRSNPTYVPDYANAFSRGESIYVPCEIGGRERARVIADTKPTSAQIALARKSKGVIRHKGDEALKAGKLGNVR